MSPHRSQPNAHAQPWCERAPLREPHSANSNVRQAYACWRKTRLSYAWKRKTLLSYAWWRKTSLSYTSTHTCVGAYAHSFGSVRQACLTLPSPTPPPPCERPGGTKGVIRGGAMGAIAPPSAPEGSPWGPEGAPESRQQSIHRPLNVGKNAYIAPPFTSTLITPLGPPGRQPRQPPWAGPKGKPRRSRAA